MARRKRTYRRRRTRRYVSRARSFGGGFKQELDGMMAGAAAAAVTKFTNMPYVDDLAVIAIGKFRKNNTLKTIGGLSLGSDLAASFLGGKGGTNFGGVY